MTELCFEDLQAGQSFTSPTTAITEADLLAYARSFDPQPMHTDPDWAARSPLGGLIASGWYTVAVALRLQQAAGFPAAALDEIANLAWPQPVRPGDQLQVRVEVIALRPGIDASVHGHVQFQNVVLNQRGETVQTMAGTVLLPRRTPQAQ